MTEALRHPVIFLKDHKDRINKFLSIFFLTYFILIFLPYIVADIPFLNNFFMGATTKLIYRSITTLYFGIYVLMLAIANEQGLKWHFIIPGLVLILCYVISIISAPKGYSYVLLCLAHRVEFYEMTTGNYSYVTYLFSFITDVIYFVMFISYVPKAIKNIKQILLTLYVLIGFMLFACAYSFIKEYSQIMQLIHGASEYDITVRSVFHSKNAFGLYLFVGCLASTFIIFAGKDIFKNWRWIFLIPIVGFTVMSYFCMCKTGIVCGIVLLFGIFLYQLIFVRNKYTKIYIIIAICIGVFLIAYIFFMLIPGLHEGALKPLYDAFLSIFNKIFGNFASRADRWSMVRYVVQGPFILIGVNETNSAYYLDIISQINQGLDFTDFHSGYVTWYASHGVIGSLIYAGLLGYLIWKIVRVIKVDKLSGFLVLMLLICCLVFMIPESYVMFISISSYAFIVNLIVVAYLEYLDLHRKEEKALC